MRNLLLTILLIVGWITFSHKAKGQVVYGDSWVEYDASTNQIRAVAWAQPDYATQAYYCAEVFSYVYQGEYNGIGQLWDDNSIPDYGGCGGIAFDEEYFPYDPSADYIIETQYSVRPIMRWAEFGGYYDYYNYTDYSYGDPVYYPLYYNFFGTGYPRETYDPIVFLGTVYSIFTEGATAGPPHHLRLVSDTFPSTNCGSVRRLLKFRVVDANGRRAGNVRVEETFETASQPPTGIQCVHNSCQNDNYCPPGCAGMDPDGTFTDQLWVGCPSAGGSCGFSPSPVVSRWWWCPGRNYGTVTLTRNTYQVSHNQVLVNGRSTAYPAGTEFR